MPAPSGMLCSGRGEKTLVLLRQGGVLLRQGGVLLQQGGVLPRDAGWPCDPRAAPYPHLGLMAAGEHGQLGQKSSIRMRE